MMSILNFLFLASAAQAFSPSARTFAISRPGTSLNVFEASSALGVVDTFYQTQPYAAAFLTCSVKASAADIVVQKREGDQTEEQVAVVPVDAQEQEFDMQRNLSFWLYGGLYQGMVQEYMFNTVFPSLFGDDHSIRTVLSQVALDMTVLTPFLCLPVAYLMKASIAPDEDLVGGLRKYKNHVQNEGLLFKYWAFWAPFQVLTFGFVPHHLRIPCIAFFSFFWIMILSNVSARAETPASE